jgi:hypothetical protein
MMKKQVRNGFRREALRKIVRANRVIGVADRVGDSVARDVQSAILRLRPPPLNLADAGDPALDMQAVAKDKRRDNLAQPGLAKAILMASTVRTSRLFTTKSLGGVDSNCARRRNCAGRHHNNQQQNGCAGKRQGI